MAIKQKMANFNYIYEKQLAQSLTDSFTNSAINSLTQIFSELLNRLDIDVEKICQNLPNSGKLYARTG